MPRWPEKETVLSKLPTRQFLASYAHEKAFSSNENVVNHYIPLGRVYEHVNTVVSRIFWANDLERYLEADGKDWLEYREVMVQGRREVIDPSWYISQVKRAISLTPYFESVLPPGSTKYPRHEQGYPSLLVVKTTHKSNLHADLYSNHVPYNILVRLDIAEVVREDINTIVENTLDVRTMTK